MIIPLLLKHKMHMRRPIRMPMQLPQQPPHRPIMRNGVWHRRNSMEPKHPLPIRSHNTPTIRPLTPRILHIIMARRVRLPDIDLNALNRPAFRITERAHSQQRLALWIVRHGVSRGHFLGIVRVEGA